MMKPYSNFGSATGSTRRESAEFMLTSQTDHTRDKAIAELDRLLASLADPDSLFGAQSAGGSQSSKWSHRRSLAFIVASSGSLWALLAFAASRMI
jgi:hypothetical protein